ncbi:hypothetical protein [Allomesorhizobium camelthorni]|uniref:Secreted protein n=1 Tax=Allomesorhizobium camelthorni TaxID=475069 RepID=A0A6G4WL97_9HYPH|nr:hypothetical protein [Mesorhizobium camelthorni]NGO55128.1 hypothetical protein [Mesorhizobium camelthorni]
MKRMITLAAASLAIASLTAPSFAQDTTTPVPGAEGGGAMTPDIDTTGATTTTAPPSIADVIEAVKANDTTASQIGTITAVGEVKVVKISELGGSATELQTTLTENQDDLTKLRSAVEANPALKAELDKQQVEVASVVATEIEADGAVTVYVQ